MLVLNGQYVGGAIAKSGIIGCLGKFNEWLGLAVALFRADQADQCQPQPHTLLVFFVKVLFCQRFVNLLGFIDVA